MRQQGGVLRLTDETTFGRVVRGVQADRLDGHLAAKQRVPRAIHGAHAAGGDECADLVGAKPRPRRQTRNRFGSGQDGGVE